MARPKPITFAESAKVRDAEVKKGLPIATKGYERLADQIHSQYRRYERSSSVPSGATRGLENAVKVGTRKVAKQVEDSVLESLSVVSKAVARDQARWVAELTGQKKLGDYTPFSSDIVKIVSSGKLYKDKMTLSDKIWRDAKDLPEKVNWIIAGGLKKGWSIYEIAMSVESYVRPSAAKQWNLTNKDGLRIWPAQVDYNAARLVRTVLQHGYQQAIKEELEANPFVEKVIWHASGPNPCPLCQGRDGRVYEIDDLPLDHPNGMCTFEPVMVKGWAKRLGEWQAGGDDEEVDEFMENYGIDLEEL